MQYRKASHWSLPEDREKSDREDDRWLLKDKVRKSTKAIELLLKKQINEDSANSLINAIEEAYSKQVGKIPFRKSNFEYDNIKGFRNSRNEWAFAFCKSEYNGANFTMLRHQLTKDEMNELFVTLSVHSHKIYTKLLSTISLSGLKCWYE